MAFAYSSSWKHLKLCLERGCTVYKGRPSPSAIFVPAYLGHTRNYTSFALNEMALKPRNLVLCFDGTTNQYNAAVRTR